MVWPWNLDRVSLNVVWNDTVRYIVYEFLMAFRSKYGPVLYHFWDKARCLKMAIFIPSQYALLTLTIFRKDVYYWANCNYSATICWRKYDDCEAVQYTGRWWTDRTAIWVSRVSIAVLTSDNNVPANMEVVLGHVSVVFTRWPNAVFFIVVKHVLDNFWQVKYM